MLTWSMTRDKRVCPSAVKEIPPHPDVGEKEVRREFLQIMTFLAHQQRIQEVN